MNDSFKKIVIYGAGSAGAKLYSALEIQDSIKITAFVDDDPKLWGLDIENIKIYSPNDIKILKEKKLVHSIILALPSIKNYKKLQIIENLKNYEIPVLQVPSLKELIENKKKINTLKE